VSNIQQHVHDSGPGIVGTGLAGSFTIVGFIDNSLPILQAVSLLIGIAVGVITFVYYYKKVKKGE
jgi:hypothetical protein